MVTKLAAYRAKHGPADVAGMMEPILNEIWGCDVRFALGHMSMTGEDLPENVSDIEAWDRLRDCVKRLRFPRGTTIEEKLHRLFDLEFGRTPEELIAEIEAGEDCITAELRLALEDVYNTPLTGFFDKHGYAVEWDGGELPGPWRGAETEEG